MKEYTSSHNLQFLSEGGEMGKLTRQKDWSNTSVGNPEIWPQSLKTTISIILNSRFPMFLWWGPELLCFYNDAYRPSLGKSGKHPFILGAKAKEAWPEIWHIIKPLIDQVINTGESVWFEDQLIPIYRNGEMEDVYWTFSYSSVKDESGTISGVLVTCYETTEKVKILSEVEERESQLNFALQAANLATWDLNPITNKFVGNNRLKEWFGLSFNDEIELPHAIERIVEKDRNRVINEIEKSLNDYPSGDYNIEYSIINPETNQVRIIVAKGRALFNEDKVAIRFSGTLQDITEQSANKIKLAKSEKQFRDIIKQAPVAITILKGDNFLVETANDSYLEIVDRKAETFIRKPLFDSLPEAKETVEPILLEVYHSGNPFQGIEFPVTIRRNGEEEQCYFNFIYHPLKEANKITGIIAIATDVTTSVIAKNGLLESEWKFRNLVMQSPIPMTIFRGPDYVIELANPVMLKDIWRKKKEDILGEKLLDVFPELKDQKYPEILKNVYETGKLHSEKESLTYVKKEDGLKKLYFDFQYAPLFEVDKTISGVIVTVTDVTEKVETRIRIENAETRLRLATEAAGLATWELNLQTKELICSDRLLEIFGHAKDSVFSYEQLKSQILESDRNTILTKAMQKAESTGVYFYEARILQHNKSIRWIRTQGKFFKDANGIPKKTIGIIQDITEEKKHQQKLYENEQKFRLLADSMPQHIWTSDPEGNLNYFNQSVYDFSGITPEQLAKEGWLQIVHPEDRPKNIEKWTEAIKTGNDFLYEHRFRRADGEYIWQLSRAIPQIDQNGKIQMWVGTSTDIEDHKRFAKELEKQVLERTKLLIESKDKLEHSNRDLKNINEELQSFAYVSSHDMQEPLRKIQTFSSRILDKEKDNLTLKGQDYFTRIQNAANRMQTLIEDLLAYSRTNTTEKVFKKIPLEKVVHEVLGELEETIEEKNVSVQLTEMCSATIIPFQFKQLLHNLIGNSIKFSIDGVNPVIIIKSEIIKGSNIEHLPLQKRKNYCHFTISDNGIGFEPQFKERIFQVFQRLHGRNEYTGTGIGLAIVKKIVDNHDGIIEATSMPNKGVTFDIYIPEKE